MSTYLQLQNRVITLGGYGETDRTRIKDYINIAQDDVNSRAERWAHNEAQVDVSTTPGSQTLTVPASVRELLRLRPVTTGLTEPMYQDWNTFSRQHSTSESLIDTNLGVPSVYSLFAGNIIFDVIADSVYTYNAQYLRTPVALVADADLSTIPAIHHDVLVYGALMYSSARTKDSEMVAYWQNMYEGKIKAMKADNKMRQYETIEKVAMPASYGGTYG